MSMDTLTFVMPYVVENDTKAFKSFVEKMKGAGTLCLLADTEKVSVVATVINLNMADFKTYLRTVVEIKFTCSKDPSDAIDQIMKYKRFRLWHEGDASFMDFKLSSLNLTIVASTSPVSVLGNFGVASLSDDIDYALEVAHTTATYNDMTFVPARGVEYVKPVEHFGDALGGLEDSNNPYKLDPHCSHEAINIGVMSEKWVCKQCDGDLSQEDIDKLFKKK